jgi:hypothetical protein
VHRLQQPGHLQGALPTALTTNWGVCSCSATTGRRPHHACHHHAASIHRTQTSRPLRASHSRTVLQQRRPPASPHCALRLLHCSTLCCTSAATCRLGAGQGGAAAAALGAAAGLSQRRTPRGAATPTPTPSTRAGAAAGCAGGGAGRGSDAVGALRGAQRGGAAVASAAGVAQDGLGGWAAPPLGRLWWEGRGAAQRAAAAQVED